LRGGGGRPTNAVGRVFWSREGDTDAGTIAALGGDEYKFLDSLGGGKGPRVWSRAATETILL